MTAAKLEQHARALMEDLQLVYRGENTVLWIATWTCTYCTVAQRIDQPILCNPTVTEARTDYCMRLKLLCRLLFHP